MRMITPGIADSLTPHSWYDVKDPRPARARRRVLRARVPHLHLHLPQLRLPHPHLPHLRLRHPQA